MISKYWEDKEIKPKIPVGRLIREGSIGLCADPVSNFHGTFGRKRNVFSHNAQIIIKDSFKRS